MFGHVGLHCMSCWLEAIHSKIQTTQETLGKLFRGFLASTTQSQIMLECQRNANISYPEFSLLTLKRSLFPDPTLLRSLPTSTSLSNRADRVLPKKPAMSNNNINAAAAGSGQSNKLRDGLKQIFMALGRDAMRHISMVEKKRRKLGEEEQAAVRTILWIRLCIGN
ncbi:hypothetical protein LINPERPRIM_LOCUS563 [Linum perenne]